MKKKLRKIGMIFGILLAIIILVVGGYLLYVILDYNRIPDKKENKIDNKTNEDGKVPVDTELVITSYNIGFGAYSQDFSFFMDGGKYSRAIDKQHVLDNTQGVIDLIDKENVDFAYFQEVDTNSTRSYHVDQSELISEALEDLNMAFAVNYHSSYLFYPVTCPHGKSNSGIMTMSKYGIESSIRRSLPVPEGFPDKFFDLDRCYSITKVPTDNGKELCLINLHLSAYSKDDSIREKQVKMLSEDMQKEYDAGNYVICGGDFNHDMIGNSYEVFDNEKNDYSWAGEFPKDLISSNFKYGVDLLKSLSKEEMIATCRNTDEEYKFGDNDEWIVDTFIVSDNVEIVDYKNINNEFKNSDHNPIEMKFRLK